MDPIEMEQIRKTAKLHNLTLEEYLNRKMELACQVGAIRDGQGEELRDRQMETTN